MDNSRIAKQLITHYAAPHVAVIVLILLSSIPSHSTATIVIVTGDGIVVTTDSRVLQTLNGGPQKIGETEGTKVLVVQHRFAVAYLGKESFNFTHKTLGQVIDYDFATWVHSIEGRVPDSASFDDFAGIINDEIRKMIPKLQVVVSGGGLQRKNPVDIFDPFIQYVIAGYQDGIPRVCVLKFYVDWDTKSMLGPYQIPIEPSGPIAGHTRFYFFGINQAATNFHNRQSYAFKQAKARCPKAVRDLTSHRSISLDEAIALARVLVSVEEQTNPDEVGGEIRTVKILPTGMASVLVEDLPKAPTGKHQQKR